MARNSSRKLQNRSWDAGDNARQTRDRRVTSHHRGQQIRHFLLFFPYPANLWPLAIIKTLPYNVQKPQEEIERAKSTPNWLNRCKEQKTTFWGGCTLSHPPQALQALLTPIYSGTLWEF